MVDQRRESPSFLQVIADARHIPEGVDPLTERDSPRMMPEADDNGLITPPGFGGIEQLGNKVNCLQFSEIFVLWRPWETCKACRDKLDAQPELMPEEGTYTCPHVQKSDYKDVIDRCLSGKGMLATKEFFNLKNGTRVVHVEWLEGDPVHMAKLEKEAAIARERAVYPPDPVTAFNKGKKKE